MAALSEAQVAEMVKMQGHYPFRIICGAVDPDTGVFVVIANPTMHKANKLARAGWHVERLTKGA